MRHLSLRPLATSAALLLAALTACSSDTPAPGNGGGAGANVGGTTAGATTGTAGANGGSATAAGSGGMAGSPTAGASGATLAGSSGNGGSAGSSGEGGEGGAPGPLELTSSAFVEGGPIDEKYRCTGDNVTPPLSWTRGPDGTQSYAVTQIHVGSQTLHWVLFDIPTSVRSLPEGITRDAMPAVPAGSKQIKPNVDGSTWYGYSGPCPGGANQSYTYFVYALDVAMLPGVTTESTAIQAGDAVKQHMLAVASLTGTASKP